MDGNNEAASKEAQIATKEAEKLTAKVVATKVSRKNVIEVSELLAQIKQTQRSIETRRKEITQPLNLALKSVNALFKEPSEKLKEAENLLKTAMLKFEEREAAKAQKKIENIENAVDSGEMEMGDAMGRLGNIQQAPQTVNSESGSATFQGRKKLKIVDVSKIPAKYFLRERVLEAIRLEVQEDIKMGAPLPEGAEYIIERNVVVRNAK